VDSAFSRGIVACSAARNRHLSMFYRAQMRLNAMNRLFTESGFAQDSVSVSQLFANVYPRADISSRRATMHRFINIKGRAGSSITRGCTTDETGKERAVHKVSGSGEMSRRATERLCKAPRRDCFVSSYSTLKIIMSTQLLGWNEFWDKRIKSILKERSLGCSIMIIRCTYVSPLLRFLQNIFPPTLNVVINYY